MKNDAEHQGRNAAHSARVDFSYLFALCLVYSSVLFSRYAYADDYFDLQKSPRDQLTRYAAQGRIIQGLIEAALFLRVKTIDDLAWIRLFTLCGLAALAMTLRRALLRAGWDRESAGLFPLIVCFLPSVTVYVSWARETAMPIVAAIAGIAALFAVRDDPNRRWFGSVVMPTLLLAAALSIYQPAAMAFWVVLPILIFRPAERIKIPPTIWIVFIAALAISFAGLKMGGYLYPKRVEPGRIPVQWNDLKSKWHWFISSPLMDSLNLVNIFPLQKIAVAVALFDAGGLFLYFRGGPRSRIVSFCLAMGLISLSYLPNLVVQESWSSYRTQIALSALLAFYTLLALRGYGRLLGEQAVRWVLRLATAGCALNAAYLVCVYFTVPQATELQFVRSQLTPERLTEIDQIEVIPSDWTDSIAPGVRYDEFGSPSSGSTWGSMAIVEDVLAEEHPQFAKIPVVIAANPAAAARNTDRRIMVLDLRNLRTMQAVVP